MPTKYNTSIMDEVGGLLPARESIATTAQPIGQTGLSRIMGMDWGIIGKTAGDSATQDNASTIQQKNAEDSDAQWARSLADLYAPVTQAEIDRRKRGANAANAIGNLGAVLSAFGNLAYTGQNAPSQTIPDFKEADTQTWEERQRARNLQYANAQMQERARQLNERMQSENAKRQDAELALRQQQMQQSAQQYADQKAYRDQQMQFERDKFDYTKSQGMTPEQLAALNDAKIKQAEASAARERAAASNAYADSRRADAESKAKIEGGYYDRRGTRGTYTRGAAGKTDTLIDSNGNAYSIDYNAIDDAGISQIYKALNGPDFSGDYTMTHDAKMRRGAQLQYIAEAMIDNPDAASILKQYTGAVTPISSKNAPYVQNDNQGGYEIDAPWVQKRQ